MHDSSDPGREVERLRERNADLVQQLADASQAMDAFARGEVDAVALGAASVTPILLEAAQGKLRRSEGLLRAVFAGSLDAMLLADDRGRYVDANQAACDLFGLSREQLLGRSIGDFVAPGSDGSASYRHVHGHGRERGQLRLQRLDGTRRVLDFSAVANVTPGVHLSVLCDITERIAAEDELRRSEARFRAVLEKSAEVISLSAADGTTRYWTHSDWRLLGWTPEELGTRTLRDQVVEEDRSRIASALEQLIHTGARDLSIEFRVQHRDGSIRWIESTATNLLDDPDVAGVVGIYRDITVRKHAEEELRASRDMLEEAQAIAHVGSWTSGLLPEGKTQLSRECASIFGLPDRSMPVASFLESVHPEDRERFRRATGYAIGHGAPLDIEHRIQRRDGGVRWVHERGVVERDVAGRPMRMVGTVQDLTERHVAIEALRRSETQKLATEAKLRQNEALVRIAGQAARLGGWSVSLPDFRVTWSDEACAIYEVPPGTLPGPGQAFTYFAPEFRETIRHKFEACSSDGTPFDLEVQIVTATGRRVWVRTIGNAERSSAGVISEIRGALQDVDDRRKLQDQVRQAQKMEAVGRLAGGVAHDFNNLLSVVLSYSELALDSLTLGDPLRGDIEEIQKAGHRATALTRQLLAFSRQQILAPRVVDLNEVVSAMTPMLVRLLGADIDMAVLSPHPIGRVLVDPGHIEQVVMNLAINARGAMPDGGRLTIETSNVRVEDANVGKPADVPQGLFVKLTVTDSGVGMTEATRARVFEPFFTTKEKGKGTGLGLATVFGIVQQSGGYVSVYSEPDHGTTFKVFLPRTDRIAEASIHDAPSAMLEGSETILLAEDEEQVRIVACAILRKHGYTVLETSNGSEALLVSSGFPGQIDLLMTDVVMPHLGGRRLAEQLAPNRPKMKVLFTSGYTDDAIIHHGVLDAGVAFLQKPFAPQALLKRIRDVLDVAPTKSEAAPNPGPGQRSVVTF